MSESANQIIRNFCEQEILPNEHALNVLVRSFGRQAARLEEDNVDLKSTFQNDPKSWPALIKDIVAMHNKGGGVLIFGINNDGARIGLAASMSATLDPTNIGNKARRYHLNGTARTAYLECSYYSKRYGFLFVHAGAGLLVFDKDVAVDKPGGSQEIVARAGVVYTRRDSATKPARQGDIDALLHRILGKGVRAFLARVEKVANLPASTQLIAQTPGASSGYVLTAAGQGVPVTIVGPSEDAQAIPLTEAMLPDLPLVSANAEVINQLRQFHADPDHRVQPGTLRRWYLRRAEISCPPDAGIFLTLSALDTRALPCYWASLVDRGQLKKFVAEQIRRDKYPARDTLPYLVAAFFWDERTDMLQNLLDRSAARRVCQATDREDFLRHGRMVGARTVRIGSRRIPIQDLYADPEAAQAALDEIIADDDLYARSKQVAYQLDLWLHADR
ncbi:ATP-binding protein [Thermopolyspora sp. NPDC052614]|uniref:ATP-binding protein n=1 Tax=Thermopolyspora sp. NPDC052614 TaxID=3155682 RepID=UPI003415A05B